MKYCIHEPNDACVACSPNCPNSATFGQKEKGVNGMSCLICGGSMVGDGHTTLRHCEFARDEDCEGKEPDAGPVYCVEIVPE